MHARTIFFVLAMAGAFSCLQLSAQDQIFEDPYVYLKAGPTNSFIQNLETTILSEPYYTNYTLKKKNKTGFTAGIGADLPISNSRLSLSTEILYAQLGSELHFENTERNFNYKMDFAYQYIVVPILLKFFFKNDPGNPVSGLNLGIGAQVGFNISPNNIKYTSGGPGYEPAFGTDHEQQQQLRNVLKGEHDLGLLAHLGYLTPSGISFDLRYYVGFSDLVKTENNSYNFIENKNTGRYAQFTIGWSFHRPERVRY